MNYCLHNLGKFPHEYDALPTREKALVIALVHNRWDEEAKAAKRK